MVIFFHGFGGKCCGRSWGKHVYLTKLVWIMFESYVNVYLADKVRMSINFLWVIISSKGAQG